MREPRVTIVVGEGYIPDLIKRMDEASITPAELAREAEVSKQELSRWLNSRVRNPSMENVAKIEIAMINLRRRRSRRTTPAKGTKASE